MVPVGLLLGIALYGGLVKLGVAPSLFAPVVRGDLADAESTRPGIRVLFVGNSFTFRNDLPGLVQRLGGTREPIYAVSLTAPGWTLAGASHTRRLTRLLGQVSWDDVVLQEQSRRPVVDQPAFERSVEALDRKVAAPVVLFLTWGYRDGYAAMQQRLIVAYSAAAARGRARIAPVGIAWAYALQRRPSVHLWSGDGRHPSRLGSYLAACVFYSVLTGHSPVGNAFSDGLSKADADFAQRIAWRVARFRY